MRSFAVTAVVLAACWSCVVPAFAQAEKPKSPAAIAEVSAEMTEKNNKCRLLANEQKLHALKRQKFLRECRKQP